MAGLVGMLFQCHVMMTHNNPLRIYSVNLNVDTFDYEKFIDILDDPKKQNEFSKQCFEEFKKIHPSLPFGSVHYEPLQWTLFALHAINNSIETKKNVIDFPNGCCTLDTCSINLYYEVVVKMLTKV